MERRAFPNFAFIRPAPINQSAALTSCLFAHCLTMLPNTSDHDSFRALWQTRQGADEDREDAGRDGDDMVDPPASDYPLNDLDTRAGGPQGGARDAPADRSGGTRARGPPQAFARQSLWSSPVDGGRCLMAGGPD